MDEQAREEIMNVMITGATGFFGPSLVAAFSNGQKPVTVARDSAADYQYDLTDEEAVKNLLGRTGPDMIIHAAAMTDINRCQQHPELAYKVNSEAVKHLVRHMRGDCRFMYISTDSIYSGQGPHKERSKTENPINIYGMTKYMGEFEAAKAANHIIIRASMYGFSSRTNRSSSLVDSLVTAFKSGKPVPLFTDLMFSPLHKENLAKMMAKVAKTNKVGTWNFGSTNGMSKSKFGLMLANGLGLPIHMAVPVESAGLPNRTPRPLDTRLDIVRTEQSFGLTMPDMEFEVKEMCRLFKCVN